MSQLDPSELATAFIDAFDELHHAVVDLLKENESLKQDLEAAQKTRHVETSTAQERVVKTLAMIKERHGVKLSMPDLNSVSTRGRW